MQQYALIVAGGNGTRMGAEMPKQFLLLAGKPILMHTLQVFYQVQCELVVVLPEYQFSYWQQLCETHAFTIPHQVVAGGHTRFHSVQNGLAVIPEQTLVAIHDGVRPCVSEMVIQATFDTAAKKGNAVAAVRPKDSIRLIDDEDNHSVNREYYRLVQTPQTFQSTLIKRAYAQSSHTDFTDDAGVLEAAGTAIHLVDGDYRNIKITTPEDLVVAEQFLK
ncbi:MAG: 2-C-methyl-D-erythritol 4-phosphate cytidylyltransferase [Bacteroidota bacterium]